MLRKLLACQGADAEMIRRMIDGDLKEAPTPLLEGRTPRHAMQTLGTDGAVTASAATSGPTPHWRAARTCPATW